MRGYFKSCISIMIITTVLLLLSGCWSHRELNEIGIVSGWGLDLNEQGAIQLTVQVITPHPRTGKDSGGEGGEVRILSTDGETLFDAVRNLMTISGDRLFHPHNQVVIIGGELARQGVQPVLDFLERDPEIRLLTWVLLTEGKAEDIIRAPSKEEKIPANHIARLVEDYASTSKVIPMNLLDLTNNVYSDGIEATIGKVEFRKDKGDPTFHMEGGGAFKGDQLVGWLDSKEARGYLWVHNEVKSGIVTATQKEAKGNPEQFRKKVSFELIRSKAKIKPLLEGEKISFTINVKVTANLGERMDHEETSKQGFDELEKLLSQTVLEEIEAIVKKAQKEFKSDIFGFGANANRKYPGYWKEHKEEWNEIFSTADVKIEVEALLADHGMIR